MKLILLKLFKNMKEINNNDYNKNLKVKANTLRKPMTKAEACLWKYLLKAKLMNGYQFRRQRPILNYIVDFVCLELRLIIEVDGITHNFDDVINNDIIRQKELESYGYIFIRFQDKEILENIEGVRIRLTEVISDLGKRIHPLPPPAGDIRCHYKLSGE